MPAQSTSSRWLKGAIVAIDLAVQGAAPKTIVFQYNPQDLKHGLTPRAANREHQGRIQALGFAGAPDETFSVSTVISASFDAAGAAGQPDSSAGIHHLLAALEMLLYPRSDQVRTNQRLLDDGQIEVGGGVYDAPLTLFVWGKNRVLPVQITGIDVTELFFDPDLNPVHAEVNIAMKALSYSDLDSSHKGHSLFLTYQQGKERLAARGVTGDPMAYLGFDPAQELR
jgi:hypothetical protein